MGKRSELLHGSDNPANQTTGRGKSLAVSLGSLLIIF